MLPNADSGIGATLFAEIQRHATRFVRCGETRSVEPPGTALRSRRSTKPVQSFQLTKPERPDVSVKVLRVMRD